MEEPDDYESIPLAPLWVSSTAGAMAGMMEHCVMYPIDSVKTRMQSLCPCPERKFHTPVGGLLNMAKMEGWWRPLRGMSAVASGAVPAHALYFSVYEKSKHTLTQGRFGHNQTLSYGLSGMLATVVHDAVMNPAEVVKQRLQMWGSPYQGSWQCARCVFKAEGAGAFYRSYSTQLLLNVPFQSIHFMMYEAGQEFLNPERRYDPASHLKSGGLAGGVAAAVTTPLDVIKTVLNTQQSAHVNLASVPATTLYNPLDGKPCAVGSAKPHPPADAPVRVTFPGIRIAAASIYASRGLAGFFSGAQARILFQVPATAISWSVYELAKWALHSRGLYNSPPSRPPPSQPALKSPVPTEFAWSESSEEDWSLVHPLK